MAKNSIRDYSATNSANTDIQSIDISEGCSPAGINNAIREVMADLKDVSTGAVALESPAMDSLTVTGSVTASGDVIRNDTTTGTSKFALQYSGADAAVFKRNNSTGVATIANGYAGAPVDAINISLAGNVGIGQSNPTSPNGATDFLHIGNSSNQDTSIVLQDAVEIWEIYNNDDLLFNFDTTNVMTLQRVTGNVGIGTTNPNSGKLHVSHTTGTIGYFESTQAAANVSNVVLNATQTNSSANATFQINHGTTAQAQLRLNGDSSFAIHNKAGLAESMRIDSSGNVVVAKTTTSNTVQGIILGVDGQLNCVIKNAGGASQAIFINRQDATGNAILFRYQNGTVGSIAINTSSVSYNTSSDYRLKTAVTYDWDATTRLKQLKPARFEWIADGDDAVPVDGFLAHEVQDIVPEAIVGEKDGMRDEEYEVTPAVEATYDDDGNILTEAVPAVMGTRSVPDYQGIDQSKLVPLLVKTIQELEARITALEAN